MCLPWFPLLVTVLSSQEKGFRTLGLLLLIVHGLVAPGLLLLG